MHFLAPITNLVRFYLMNSFVGLLPYFHLGKMSRGVPRNLPKTVFWDPVLNSDSSKGQNAKSSTKYKSSNQLPDPVFKSNSNKAHNSRSLRRKNSRNQLWDLTSEPNRAENTNFPTRHKSPKQKQQTAYVKRRLTLKVPGGYGPGQQVQVSFVLTLGLVLCQQVKKIFCWFTSLSFLLPVQNSRNRSVHISGHPRRMFSRAAVHCYIYGTPKSPG